MNVDRALEVIAECNDQACADFCGDEQQEALATVVEFVQDTLRQQEMPRA